MLPFLANKKKSTGLAVQIKPEDFQSEQPQEDEAQPLEIAAQDMADALASGDMKRLAAAIRAAYEILEFEEEQNEEIQDPEVI